MIAMTDDLMPVGEICKILGMSRTHFYRLYHADMFREHPDPTSEWRKQPRLMFRLSEVRAALARRREGR